MERGLRAPEKGRRTGERHHNWKGGTTKTLQYIRFTPEYKAWRRAVFTRDNFTCQHCGVRGVKLHADHILPQSVYPELRFEVSNGRTLCVPCHKKTPTWGIKALNYNSNPDAYRAEIEGM